MWNFEKIKTPHYDVCHFLRCLHSIFSGFFPFVKLTPTGFHVFDHFKAQLLAILFCGEIHKFNPNRSFAFHILSACCGQSATHLPVPTLDKTKKQVSNSVRLDHLKRFFDVFEKKQSMKIKKSKWCGSDTIRSNFPLNVILSSDLAYIIVRNT